jgi:hypothetical protein
MYGTTRMEAEMGSPVDRAVFGPSLGVAGGSALWLHSQIMFAPLAVMAALSGVAMDSGVPVYGT